MYGTRADAGDGPGPLSIKKRPEVGVRFACITTWPTEAKGPVVLKSLPGDPDEVALLEAARTRRATIWAEFELVGERSALSWFDPTLEPWDEDPKPAVRWKDVGAILRLLGVDPPATGNHAPASLTLSALELVYTLGIRRAQAELGTAAAAVTLLPAVGFEEPGKNQAAWMNRVGIAAVENLVFTLRLPADPWPPGDDADPPPQRPTLRVMGRFIPASGQPKATELATGIALYQAATCGAIITREKDELQKVENTLLAATLPSSEQPSRDRIESERLAEGYRKTFGLGERGEMLEHELARLCARFDDVSEATELSRAMVAEALATARAFRSDLRQRIDCIASMVATQQFALADEQQSKTDKFHRRATVVGSAVLVPALVAAVFGANVALPGEKEEGGLAAMIFLMVALGAGTWWGISSLDEPEARLTRRPWKVKYAHVHAGFVLAIASLVFGIAALTPPADEKMSGPQALGAITGVALVAMGLAATVWCRLNRVHRPPEWWTRKPLAATVTRVGAWAAPVAVAVGAVLSVLLFHESLPL